MTTKGPSIAPRQQSVAQSPIALAGSPPSSASAGSTPRSVASPNNPHNNNNNNNNVASPPNNAATRNLTTKSVTLIMTSKEWVLPPRPKPGRKPSVDTPASKRKAQNRAAQRAFRERRATRVQELEEKLMEVEKEKDIKEMALINTINKLKAENNFLTKSMEQIRQEMAMFRASQEEMRLQMSPRQHGHSQQQQQQQQQQQVLPQPPRQNIAPAPPQQFSKRHSSNSSSSSYSQLSLQPTQQQQQQQQQQQYYANLNAVLNPSPLNNISPTGSSYSLQQISPAPSADLPPTGTTRNGYQIRNTMSRNNSSNSNSTQHTLTPISNNNTPDKIYSTSNTSNNNDNNGGGAVGSSEFDCGVCIKDECLCESVGLKEPRKTDAERELENQINSIKPQPAVTLRRKRKAQSIEDVEEIDFTRQFATKAKPMPDLNKLRKHDQKLNTTVASTTNHNHHQHIQSRSKSIDKIDNSDFNEDSPMENCGFCSDDTPCVCREAAKEAARLNASLNGPDSVIVEEEEDEEQEEGMNGQGNDHNTLPPLQFNLTSNNSNTKMALPVMHPGPSVEIRDITNLTPGAVPTVIPRPNQSSSDSPSSSSSSQQQQQMEENGNSNEDSAGGCTGNPGTCRQCQMDPMSTLFCTTVASKSNDSSIRSNLSRTNSRASLLLNFGPGTPGASSNNNGNNNSNNAPSPIPPPLLASNSSNNIAASPGASGLNAFTALLPSTPGSGSGSNNNDGASGSGGGMFIPCADAYKTLSRHKKFNSVDFSTLVGKLTTRGMQVEVQSVANVLRELDRRLYN